MVQAVKKSVARIAENTEGELEPKIAKVLCGTVDALWPRAYLLSSFNTRLNLA